MNNLQSGYICSVGQVPFAMHESRKYSLMNTVGVLDFILNRN
jgi:hypothetical protein